MSDGPPILVLDFETYYDARFSLKSLSIPEYVHDPRLRVHGLAIRWPDGRTEFRHDVDAAVADITGKYGRDIGRAIVVGHHLQFDGYILNHKFGIRPRHIVDTMLLAHQVHGRRNGGDGTGVSLEALAKRYNLDAKGNLDFMTGVIHPNVRQRAELSAYARHDVELTYQLFTRLLPQISRPEVDLPLMVHTIRLFTEGGIAVDVEGIAELEREIRAGTEASLQEAGVSRHVVSANTGFASILEGRLAESGRTLPRKPGKRGMIAATAKRDAEMQALVQDHDANVAALARARLAVKGEDQKLARLERLCRIAAATGGVLPPYLVYHGAHTGRFAGGGGFNIQNLGRSGLGGRVRSLLRPRRGQVFVIGDLAQIEARITAWFAGQQDMLDAFAAGRDIYAEFATQTFGREVRKPAPIDPPILTKELAALRQVGKAAVLGLGYGMGARKFMDTLRSDPATAGLFDRGDLDAARCVAIVQDYRRQFNRIPAFWRDLEFAARDALRGVTTTVAGMNIHRADDQVRVQLPSGWLLRYPNLRIDPTQRPIRYLTADGAEEEFTPEEPGLVYGKESSLYGGKICENVVQAAARDVLAEAIMALERRGYRVVFHVHDEVVVEVAADDAAAAAAAVNEELTRRPVWAPDLPLAAEVQVADSYGKS